jgi:putative transposase
VQLLCRVLCVSRAGYYDWHGRGPSARAQADAVLLAEIREIHAGSRKTYGSPRVHAALRARGHCCSRKRVARLLRAEGLTGRRQPRYVVTTQGGGGYQVAANLLARRFCPGALRAWAADLTYISTGEGTLYLAVVVDIYSRRVLGWSMGNSPAGQLAVDALKMALATAPPQPGQLCHSDRGGHYLSSGYRSVLAQHGLQESMSRKGDCWDNAVVESFFATLKRELLYPRRLDTRRQARALIFEYLEVFYNRQRSHSALGYLSPVAYEKLRANP